MDTAQDKKASIYFADTAVTGNYESDLKGAYQKHNIKTVLRTVLELKKKGYKITESNIARGLNKVIENTGLQGRWQILSEHPKVIADTAHNKEGLAYTMTQLKSEPFNKLHVVIGVVNDKNLESIINLFPKEAQYYFCKPNVQRGLDAIVLKDFFIKRNYQGEVYNSVVNAFDAAKKQAKNEDLIYVGGSTFVVAEII